LQAANIIKKDQKINCGQLQDTAVERTRVKEKGSTSLQNRHEITEKERGDDWHREQN